MSGELTAPDGYDPIECPLCHVSFSRWNREPGTGLCKGCHADFAAALRAHDEKLAAGAPSVDKALARGPTPPEDDTPHLGD